MRLSWISFEAYIIKNGFLNHLEITQPILLYIQNTIHENIHTKNSTGF